MYTPVSLVLILVDSHMLIHDTLWGGGSKTPHETWRTCALSSARATLAPEVRLERTSEEWTVPTSSSLYTVA